MTSPRLTVAARASIQVYLSPKESREPGDGEAEQSAARRLDEPAVDELLARAAQRLGGDAEATGEGRTRHGPSPSSSMAITTRSWQQRGRPHPITVGAIALEIIGGPILLAWQRHLAAKAV